jgi:hydrogenase/urease accessory protein HupE
MRVGLTLLLLAGALLFLPPAGAHEVRPAYLRIQQVADERFDLLWRVPARGDLRLSIYVALPDHCKDAGQRLAWNAEGTWIERWTAVCPGGLFGHRVRIDGLSSTVIDALARIERLDGTTQVARLTPAEPAFDVTAAESAWQVARTYTVLGVEHILLGIDHLLFVLALLMLVPSMRMLVWTITSFTLAHSLTLAAATLGWVHVPQAPVEAVIALSILFVAMEIVHWRQGRPGITRRWPWLVAFTFGLLHGFGFAGALSEIGLPEHAIPLALLVFNVGVDLGQLAFIGAVVVLSLALKRFAWPDWAWRVPVYLIGSLAAFWTIERIVGFA